MHATIIEFNDSGKMLSKKKTRVYFASSEKVPKICVKLPGRNFTHREVQIPIKGLLALIVNRFVEHIGE